MKIDLARLSEERPVLLSAAWDARGQELDAPGICFEGPVKIAVSARRDSGLAIAEVDAASRVIMTCARCLGEVAQDFRTSFTLTYSLDLCDPVVDLDDDIRQELILKFPQKILCRDDCRGLCPKCGADLNIEKCKCWK